MIQNKHKGAAFQLFSFSSLQKMHASLKGLLLVWSPSPILSQIEQKQVATAWLLSSSEGGFLFIYLFYDDR